MKVKTGIECCRLKQESATTQKHFDKNPLPFFFASEAWILRIYLQTQTRNRPSPAKKSNEQESIQPLLYKAKADRVIICETRSKDTPNPSPAPLPIQAPRIHVSHRGQSSHLATAKYWLNKIIISF